MTIHRLMSVIASEQVRLRRDEQTIETPQDDRSDAAAEQ
jgi:hypothetical protein